MSANPVLVEVTRGEMVESRHRGAFAVIRSDGQIVAAEGDLNGLIYPRSAIKPIQAINLVESGASDAYQLGEIELALACASHNGEAGHVETVRDWLRNLGLDESALECGAHPPRRSRDRQSLLQQQVQPGPAHNNCSGKHAGFLSTALHGGYPTAGYIDRTHPVQQDVLSLLGDLAGVSLGQVPQGIDGCGIPVAGIALQPLALAFARFGTGDAMPPARASAARQIYQAMVRQPFMVAGTDRWCTRAIAAGQGAFIVKTGAEGVYCGAVPEARLGIALKIDDGAHRASECVMGTLLSKISTLQTVFPAGNTDLVKTPVLNVAGKSVGTISAAATLSGVVIDCD